MSLKSYIITLKEQASEADISKVKTFISDLGGHITNEFSLIKGFSVKLPEDKSASVKDHEHVFNIEEDGPVKTQ